MAAAVEASLPYMTAEEFLAWPGDGSGRKFELVDGVPRAMSPASTTHGTIQAQLAFLLVQHMLRSNSQCRVVNEPAVQTRLRAQTNRRVPDIGVTCTPDERGQVEIPDPILLIEILSPGNKIDTWNNIWTYAPIPSLSEILIIHSTRIFAELLRRASDGSWPADPTAIPDDGTLTLESIGFACPLSEVYAGTYLRRT